MRAGRLTFDRVSFAYPSRPQTAVLRGVSFGAEPGRVCAVVGASGAGKSTLFHLLQVTSPPLSRAFELVLLMTFEGFDCLVVILVKSRQASTIKS